MMISETNKTLKLCKKPEQNEGSYNVRRILVPDVMMLTVNDSDTY